MKEGCSFDKVLHVKYWHRCLESLLPTQYTTTDSSRMSLGFFILSALDILGEGVDTFSSNRRIEIRDWILNCQHPNGGFCGSPNHRFPDEYYVDPKDIDNTREIDPANLPATYFAILSLGLVGDLKKIERTKCLCWLKKLQRDDGSFGEFLTSEGNIWGGRDMRYCYVAAAIRWILRGDGEGFDGDINIEKLTHHIRSGQTYDGGISESSYQEAHAGYTYCAIATLSILNRLPKQHENITDLEPGILNISQHLRWLISRQVNYQITENYDFILLESGVALQQISFQQTDKNQEIIAHKKDLIGFNGRCNKQVDTCYSYWVMASLKLLCEEKLDLMDKLSCRRFLIEQTQYRIGGFGKNPGDPSDIYHSYLGLAALALNNESNIKNLDPSLCISVERRNRIAELRNDLLVPFKLYWNHGYCFSMREDDPEFDKIIASRKDTSGQLQTYEGS